MSVTVPEPRIRSHHSDRTSTGDHDVQLQVAALVSAIDSLDTSSVFSIQRDVLKQVTETIEAGARRLQQITRTFREHLNSTIATLPDELLLQIFETAASNGAEKMGIALSISHVCRHWRDVALRSPVLWDTITKPALLPLNFERHRLAPLNVIWDSWDEERADITVRTRPLQQALVDYLHEVKYLDLRLETAELDQLTQTAFKCKAPVLESLSLCHFHYVDQHHSWEDVHVNRWVANDYHEDVVLFPISPSLQKVYLKNVELQWPKYAHVWPSLTSLEIDMASHPARVAITLPNLLEMLAVLSGLESLALKKTVDTFMSFRDDLDEEVERLVSDATTPLIVRPLRVPKLRNIFLDLHHVGSVLEFLRHTELSSQCTFGTNDLLLTADDQEQGDNFALAAVTLAFRNRSTKWTSLYLDDGKKYDTKRRGMRIGATGTSESGLVTFALYLPLSPRGRHRLIKLLASFSAFAAIESLSVVQEDAQVSAWRALFDHFPNVRCLTVRLQLSFESLVAALEGSEGDSLLPRLEKICLLTDHGLPPDLNARFTRTLRARGIEVN